MNSSHHSLLHIRNLFTNISIRDVMISPVVTISQEANLSKAVEKFIANRVTHLVVVDGLKRLTGIITQKYLYKTRSPRRIIGDAMEYHPDFLVDGNSVFDKKILDGYILKQVMKKTPFSLKATDSVVDAILNMSSKNLGAIPIVDGRKKVVGLVTEQEIINFLAQVFSAR